MRFFSGFSHDEKERIRYIVSDVDDTITSDGALIPDALEALYQIRENGLKTILVTGGSAGWADGYIRQWPVEAVIAESGAVLLYKDKTGSVTYRTNPLIENDPDFPKKRAALLSQSADYVFSSDQYARLFDVAYERKALSEEKEKRLFEIIESLGAHALVSSIHVNVLFSPISKKKGIDAFFPILKDVLNFDGSIKDFYLSSLALGDSLNDEAMFEAFYLSVGNKRVADSYDTFSHRPTYVTGLYGGKSFSSVINDLLS